MKKIMISLLICGIVLFGCAPSPSHSNDVARNVTVKNSMKWLINF